MRNLAKKHLLNIEPYTPGKPISEVKRELGLKDVIKLASNENALPPSGRVLSSIARAARELNRYPDGGCFYLKQDLAALSGLKPSNFIIGNGSDEVITFVIRTFVGQGEEVVISKPTFLVYGIVAKVEDIKVRFVPLKGYRYDLKAMERAITPKTKVVFIANPDNPTGTYVTKKEVADFIAGLPKGVIVIFDEAYYEFARENRDYPDTLSLLKKGRNIIITRSFSKIYSLAGLRIGYGMASEEAVECMEKVREPFNVNSLAQEAARAALKDKAFVERTRSDVREGKEFLYERLRALRIDYVPSAANFILLKIGKDAPYIYDQLLKQGVIIRDMRSWGLPDCLRVTVGTMRENRRFIATLKEVINNINAD